MCSSDLFEPFPLEFEQFELSNSNLTWNMKHCCIEPTIDELSSSVSLASIPFVESPPSPSVEVPRARSFALFLRRGSAVLF